MATATMGLRRRVTVNNSPTPTNQQNSPSTSSSTSTNVSNKRSRTENNNSPSHGNLNSLNASRDEPPIKKSRGNSGNTLKARANSPAVTDNLVERNQSHHLSGKGRNVTGGKSNKKNSTVSTVTTTNNTNVSSSTLVNSTNLSNGQHIQSDVTSSFNVLGTNGWPAVPSNNIPDPSAYGSITALNMSGSVQSNICATGSLAMPSSIPYMATSMATFVGNATNLNKNSSVSYLDISNMTGGSLSTNSTSNLNANYQCKTAVINSSLEGKGNNAPLPFSGVVPAIGSSSNAYSNKQSTPQVSQTNSNDSTLMSSVKNFQNDTMFNAYQPWVIKTYGDLAKTKTITIKKYARILRTLKGEEVNSAENSKFRFWVKSKGFHIGQPVGYDAKPADRIVGRHAVTSPGLDPPLYVPTQLPHNKALNGAEGTVPPGRIYKKVAIVENFFDIIHAVHVDLEGRPGKHAGQKRTYRTITETYAFLPREAVTRFLLGCTECQRRPRTPSPSNLSNQSQVTAVSTLPTATTISSTGTGTNTTTSLTPLSPIPAATALSAPQQVHGSAKPREASHPPESKSLFNYRHPKHQQRSNSSAVAKQERDKDKERFDKESEKVEKDKERDEKYNPLSVTNLLKKETTSGFIGNNGTTTVNDCLNESRRTPESDRASSRSSASSKRKRMLPEGRTPSPPPTLPFPTPWSPGLDTKNTPIDYSLPITTTYLKYQQRIQAERNKAAAAALQEERERDLRERDSSIVVTMETDIERDRFSPAAGLIDTNLNLLATIQHLHCQVMLALTERLRPSVLPASLMLPPPTGIFPNILIGNEFSMPMAHHHS